MDFLDSDYSEEIVSRAVNGPYPRIIETVRTVIDYCRVGKTLDIGPGFGVIPRILQKFGFEITVVDHHIDSEKRNLFEKFGFCFIERDASLYPLPIQAGSFDIVLLCEVIEHSHVALKLMLHEIYRVLRPGGILIVTTPNFVNLRKRLWMFFGYTALEDVRVIYETTDLYERHVHEYTLRELDWVLRASGFDILKIKQFDWMAFETEVKNKSKCKLPMYERGFHLNSLKQWLKLPYLVLTNFIPSFRDTLLAVARKPDHSVPA